MDDYDDTDDYDDLGEMPDKPSGRTFDENFLRKIRQDKREVAELQVLAVRFLSLPNMLNSSQRSERKYAHEVLAAIIPAQRRLTYLTEIETDYAVDGAGTSFDGKGEFLAYYQARLQHGDYAGARNAAYGWLRFLRERYEELSRTERFVLGNTALDRC
jgi:hypothetical protein